MGGMHTYNKGIRQRILDILNDSPSSAIVDIHKKMNETFAITQVAVVTNVRALLNSRHITRESQPCKECGNTRYLYSAKKKEYE